MLTNCDLQKYPLPNCIRGIDSTSLTKSSGKGILRSNKANPFPFTHAQTAKFGPECKFTARAVLSRPLYVPKDEFIVRIL